MGSRTQTRNDGGTMGESSCLFILDRWQDDQNSRPDIIHTSKKGDQRQKQVSSTMKIIMTRHNEVTPMTYEITDMFFMILLIILGISLIIDNKV